jgi:hypothetical protein
MRNERIWIIEAPLRNQDYFYGDLYEMAREIKRV